MLLFSLVGDVDTYVPVSGQRGGHQFLFGGVQ